jgi:hypothetical protein
MIAEFMKIFRITHFKGEKLKIFKIKMKPYTYDAVYIG